MDAAKRTLSRVASYRECVLPSRNENVVIEKHGHYQNVEGSARMGMVLDHGVDLRLFFHREKNNRRSTPSSRTMPMRAEPSTFW
ncbi:MAG: hypothetical protein AAFQ82_21905 [Myxococcota bacterium]